MSKKILRLTAHYVEDYEACPLVFHRVVNLQVGEPSKPSNMARGTAIHMLLASYYTGKLNKVDFDENVTNAIKNFEVESMNIDGLLVEDIDTCISNFSDYCAWYRERDEFEVVSIEETLSKILYEDDNVVILYEGTQDMIVFNQGINIPYDHKSESSKMTPSSLSNQFMGYCYLTGENRIIRNAIGFQKTKGPSERFYRTMYSYSNEKIAWWKERTIRKGLRILESYAKDEWEPNFYACDTLHRRGCGFRSVCSEGEDMWTELLDKDFVHVELYDRRKLKGNVYDSKS